MENKNSPPSVLLQEANIGEGSKRIVVLGSTGSIGRQTLDVVRRLPGRFAVVGLACGVQLAALIAQIEEFTPEAVSVAREEDAEALRARFPSLRVSSGNAGLLYLAGQIEYDLLVNALVGILGLLPTLTAGKIGRNVALANKETLVAGGELVTEVFRQTGAALLPVDSEHSAIFQALRGNARGAIRRLILTASGGPFRGMNRRQIAEMRPEQALKHPNWEMGAKVTIDSATLMNKGLEVIEARWLFDVPQNQIEVVVHKESLIHSMVEFRDCSVIAQISRPDMRLPISYALNYPERPDIRLESVDFAASGGFSFAEPDYETFPCLALARQALAAGGGAPAALNAANEVLVAAFLRGEIGFYDISDGIERVLAQHRPEPHPTIDAILEIDRRVREQVQTW